MAPEIYPHTDETVLISHLRSYLPYSLPLIRRLQFMSFPGGKTPDSRLLSSCSPDSLLPESPTTSLPKSFVFAYLDFSRGPETEMWLFSSLELGKGCPSGQLTFDEQELCRDQIVGLFGKLKEIEEDYVKSDIGRERGRQRSGVVNCGTLHECVVELVEKMGFVAGKTVPTLKFLSNITELPPVPNLPSHLKWRVPRIEDIEYILTKTSIPRKIRTVRLLPVAAVIDVETGSLAAWAFLGVDASLTHLYVEEKYRGLGLAKAVSLKLYHEKIPLFGSEPIAHADVEIQNTSSQGVAKSLGGVHKWTIHWTWIQFSNI